MLHFIRERAQGWIAWFIVGLITIPFALWGVNSYISGQSDVVVATVNGDKIKQDDLQQAVQRYRDQMRNAMGAQFDPAMFEGDAIKREILNGMIEQKLLADATQDLGQRVSDKTIAQYIHATPAFQKDGKFDSQTYEMLLARAGYSPASYEAQLRSDMLSQQLTSSIQASAFVTNNAINHLLSLEQQTRDIAYGVVPVAKYLADISVTDEEVKHFYSANLDNFAAPEQVSVNYLSLSVAELAKQVKVDDTALKTFYANNKNKFVGPEQRRVSHILIEGDEAKAKTTLAEIQQKLKEGADFADLAKQYSNDTGSKDNGGDLGYIQKGMMGKPFEDAVFALANKGDISPVVKTEFGYHLIKLTDIRQSAAKSFKEVKTEVERQYRLEQAQTKFFDMADQLANLSYENPDNLDVTAEALGLPIQSSELFTRNGAKTGIAQNDKVVAAAFSDDVLKNDLNSAVIELSKDEIMVIHKKSHKPSSTLPFESVAPAIKQNLKFQKASAQAREVGKELLLKAKQTDDPSSLFAKNTWTAAATYGRNSSDEKKISLQVLQKAFAIPAPTDKSEFAGFTADNGNYVIVEVKAVHTGDPEKASTEDRDGLKAQLMRINGSAEMQAFIASLKADADISIHDKKLQ